MKHNLKKTIKFLIYLTPLIIISCTKDKEDKVEVLNINGKEILNQFIYFNKDSIDFKKSHFYKVNNDNCIEYHSILDTLNAVIGKNRFIIFKTSDSIKSDFSNINKLILNEFVFMDKQKLCLDKKSTYKYGIIEDVVFLKTDSIINGESAERIITLKQYINLKDSVIWHPIDNNRNDNDTD